MARANQTPEQAARENIDSLLTQAGWAVQSKIDFSAGLGVAVREYQTDTGPADYVIFFDNHEASPHPWTKKVWYYDYRTNIHHTLKKKPLRFEDLQDFIQCYHPQNRWERRETWDAEARPEGRWRVFSYDEILARDKTSLDIFWLKDKSLADLDNLPEPDELAAEIIENLESGLARFREIATALER